MSSCRATNAKVEPEPRPNVPPPRESFALLVALCALASLSGCLTAAKIAAWQGMVYGWGMDSSAPKPCQVASAKASAYLANANQRLAEAGKLTDLASDGQAKQLVNSAALACGKKVQ